MSESDDEPGIMFNILVMAIALVLVVALGICTRLAEVSLYGDWECFSKQCVIVPNGDGDASSIP